MIFIILQRLLGPGVISEMSHPSLLVIPCHLGRRSYTKKQKIAPTPPLRMNVFEFNVNEEPTNSTQTTDGILSVNGINITPTTNDGSLSMNGIQPTLHQRALDPGSGVVLVQGKSKKPTCVNAHTIPSCPPSYSFTHSVGRCFTCLAGTNQPLQNQ